MIRPFSYLKPRTLEEALEALQGEGARAFAGGTDLLVEMRDGERQPDTLVDIKALDELKALSIDPEKGASIGACVPLNVLVDNAQVRRHLPVLSEAAFSIATYQLRNRATVGGNICNASPAADMAPPLYILGAVLVIAGPAGERRLPISEFLTGVKRTDLKRGELLLRVEIPSIPQAKTAFLKKQRIKGHDLALINVAGLADKQAGIFRICVGACAATPVLLADTDSLYKDLKDVEGSAERLAERLAELSDRAIFPIDDVRSSKEYRRDMVRVFIKRLVGKICSGG